MTSKTTNRQAAMKTPAEKPAEKLTAMKAAVLSTVSRARDMAGSPLGERVDVRGWKVYSSDDIFIGSVDSIFMDSDATAVRYLGVALRDPETSLPAGTVLVPVGSASRSSDGRSVVLNALSSRQLEAAPRVQSQPVTPADEAAALTAYSMTNGHGRTGDFYSGPAFAEGGLFMKPDVLAKA